MQLGAALGLNINRFGKAKETRSYQTTRFVMIRSLIISVFMLSHAFALGGCSETWSGVKKDTGDNMQTTGSAIEKTGEKIKK